MSTNLSTQILSELMDKYHSNQLDREKFNQDKRVKDLQFEQAKLANEDAQGLRNALQTGMAPLGGVAPGVPGSPEGLQPVVPKTPNPDKIALDYWSQRDPVKAGEVMDRIAKQAESIHKMTGDSQQAVDYLSEATGKPYSIVEEKGQVLQIKDESNGQTHIIDYSPKKGAKEVAVIGSKAPIKVGSKERLYDTATGKILVEGAEVEPKNTPIKTVDLGDKVRLFYQNAPPEDLKKTVSPNTVVMAAAAGQQHQFNNEQVLRNQFLTRPAVKERAVVQEQVQKAREALNEAKKGGSLLAVDQTLITTFNKMLDPNSVVRESEYARTPQDMAFLERVKGGWEKLNKGGAGLSTDERLALGRMISRFDEASRAFYKNEEDSFRNLAGQYPDVQPDRVVGPSSQPLGTLTSKTVRMRNPKDGTERDVPQELVEKYLKKGGVLVK